MLLWISKSPTAFSTGAQGERPSFQLVHQAESWTECNHFSFIRFVLLRNLDQYSGTSVFRRDRTRSILIRSLLIGARNRISDFASEVRPNLLHSQSGPLVAKSGSIQLYLPVSYLSIVFRTNRTRRYTCSIMQGFNKYYPPDYDSRETSTLNSYRGVHALGVRAKHIDKGILTVR
jgi:hypothetical protein